MKSSKSRKHSAIDRPQPGQIEAIRKLLRQGEADAARQRIRTLQRSFPHFKPLAGLAYEVEAAAGNPILAPLAAWDWSRASPNSPAAWQALADGAATAGLSALALSALRRCDELAGRPAAAEPAPQPTPFGDLSLDEAMRQDLCVLLLSAGRLDEAGAMVAGIDHVSARNNHALVVFAQGRIEEALNMLEDNWRAEPANLFGLERILRLRLWLHGGGAAAELVAPLLSTAAQRPDNANGKLSGLLLLDRLAEAENAYREYEEADWWEGGQPEAWFHYLGAYAAWRADDRKIAIDRLDEALGCGASFAPADEAYRALTLGFVTGEQPDWQIGDRAAWWPLGSIEAIRRHARDMVDLAGLGLPLPHLDYLQAMAEKGGNGMRLLAEIILKEKAGAGDEGARQALLALLTRPGGPDSARTEIHHWLVEHGVLEKTQAVPVLISGKVRDIRPMNITVHAEPDADTELAPEDQADYERMHDATQRGHFDKAHRLMLQLAGRYPDSPRILANLAAIESALKLPRAEWEPRIRRAFEIDPDYLFARTHLARMHIQDGQFEEARRLLLPLAEREKFHISEWRAYMTAQSELAAAEGDIEGALRARRSLREMEERFKN